MLPENPETNRGSEEPADPRPKGIARSRDEGEAGAEGMGSPAAPGPDQEEGAGGPGCAAEEAPENEAGLSRPPESESDSEVSGDALAADDKKTSHRIDDVTFRVAVKAADGDSEIVAKALGCTARNVRARMERDPELVAIYGGRKGKWFEKPAGPAAPSGIAPFTRKPSDIPNPTKGMELSAAVDNADREQFRLALQAAGVSKRFLDRTRALDGLAKDSGRLMATSLNMTHQTYLGQLFMLGDLAEDVRERIKGHKNDDGTYSPLSPQDFAAFANILKEIAKEWRAGYTVTMQGTEALLRMIAAANGADTQGTGKVKPAWGAAKNVNPQNKDASENQG